MTMVYNLINILVLPENVLTIRAPLQVEGFSRERERERLWKLLFKDAILNPKFRQVTRIKHQNESGKGVLVSS